MKTNKLQTLLITFLIATCTFFGGYYFGKRGFSAEVKRNPPAITVINKEPKNQTMDFSAFWRVYEALNRNYIDRPLDSEKLLYGAISGMVQAVGDDYTSFFNPAQNELAKSSLNGEYEGIGAELGFKDKQLIVVAPLEGSPAQAAGVKAGDEIREIEGAPTVGITLSEAVSKIRGKSGTVSTLKIQSKEEIKDLKITRGKIVTKSVTWKDAGNGIGYLRLSRFGENTIEEWNTTVSEMIAQMPNLKGVILDVRGNPGGYLTASIHIASEFMSDGNVIYEERADGSQRPEGITRKGKLIKYPIVVMIDGGSASASEIVAAALRDEANAKLVGVKSFGKGTIQTSEEFRDGSSLHVTIAKWLTPKKDWIHKKGIEPDFVIERGESTDPNVDPQLDKAKEVLKDVKR